MRFNSFKKELLFYILGLIFVAIILTTAISVFSIKTAGNDATEATSTVLRIQAEKLLIQITTAAAEQQDLLFEQIRNDTKNLAFYTSNIYENPSFFSTRDYWNFDTRVIYKDNLYINSVSDVSTFHIPSFVDLDSNKKRNIELTSALDFFVPSMLSNNENVAAVYTIDRDGVTRYFPNIVLGELGPPDYDPREDIYYSLATPDSNPEKNVVWSPLYDDVAGRGLMITATAPVYTKDKFMGIAATDVLLESITEKIISYSPIDGSYVFLVDKEGETIAFPDRAYKDILGRPRAVDEGRTNLLDHDLPQGILPALSNMKNGIIGFNDFFNGDGEHLFMAYAPLNQTGFIIGIVAKEEVILKAVGTLRGEILGSVSKTIIALIIPGSLVILLIALIVSIFIAGQVVGPIQKLTEGVREISKGNLDYSIKIKNKNEIGELASSFNHMSSALKESRQKLYEYSRGLEEQVKERTKELIVANSQVYTFSKAKSEFISIASHQLRTPLTAIKGYVSMILEGSYGKIPKATKRPLENVFKSNERLVGLVNDLLSLSRIESGKIKLEPKMASIEEVIDGVVFDMKINADKKKLYLKVEKPSAPIGKMMLDSDKMRQVILNLVDNAIKYTDKGGIEIKISAQGGSASGGKNQSEKGKTEEEKLKIQVADTGGGMSKEDMVKIFESFSRGSVGQKKFTEGSGLGLYIARKFTEMHKGKLWAESEGEGKGSTFFIELPVRRG